jgi:hypothetical protein
MGMYWQILNLLVIVLFEQMTFFRRCSSSLMKLSKNNPSARIAFAILAQDGEQAKRVEPKIVDLSGLEPLASCLQSRRSTN